MLPDGGECLLENTIIVKKNIIAILIQCNADIAEEPFCKERFCRDL